MGAGKSTLTHIAASGEAHMVDVGEKAETARSATAEGYVRMAPAKRKALSPRILKGWALAMTS